MIGGWSSATTQVVPARLGGKAADVMHMLSSRNGSRAIGIRARPASPFSAMRLPLVRSGDPGRAEAEEPCERGAEGRRSDLATLVVRALRLHHIVRRRPVRPGEGVRETLAIELRMALPTPPGRPV